MPEVRIVFLESKQAYNEYGDDSVIEILREGIKDWEFISDVDYDFLRKNIHNLYSFKDFYIKPIILRKDELSITQRINSVRELINKEKERQKKEEALYKQKQKEKEEKKKKKLELKRATTEEEEKKLLEELKRKYETK